MEKITQLMLSEYLVACDTMARLRKVVLEELKKGTPVQPGVHTAVLSKSSRRSPSWKAVVKDRLGVEVVDEVIDNTSPKEVVSLRIS